MTADDIHKVHKRLLDDQMCSYFSNFFSTKLCGFHEGYNAQRCFLAMTEKRK